MHSEPMAETEGTFSDRKDAGIPCRKCKAKTVVVETWDSNCGGYTDWKYTCLHCKHVWWVDGIDS